MAAAPVAKTIALLESEYGIAAWNPRKEISPLDLLIGTILSQNTSDKNSAPAFENLKKKFKSWEKVAEADWQSIAKTIRSGGLANIKAKRIKQVLQQIKQQNKSTNKFNLSFLALLPPQRARDWLLELHGVGPKTAAVVLMFSFGMPIMPCDTHVIRLSSRLGWIPQKSSIEKAHEILDAKILDSKKMSAHLNLIAHGRKICHAQRPACDKCILNKICPSAFKFPNFRRN